MEAWLSGAGVVRGEIVHLGTRHSARLEPPSVAPKESEALSEWSVVLAVRIINETDMVKIKVPARTRQLGRCWGRVDMGGSAVRPRWHRAGTPAVCGTFLADRGVLTERICTDLDRTEPN